MSLARALSRLPEDEGTETVVRDVLMLFSKHEREWFTIDDVKRRTGHALAIVERVVSAMQESYVLSVRAGEPTEYSFAGDIALVVEIDSFVRRIRAHRDHMQNNVAKFRERYSPY